MGVLDTVGGAADWYSEKAGDAFEPMQRGVQSTVERTTGMDEDEFARASARTAERAGDVISTPGRKFGEATEGTAIDNPASDAARRGGETIWDWWVKHPATVAYGTTTGADLHGENPEHATAGRYEPGALESMEVAFPLALPAKTAVRAGAKGIRGVAKGSGKASKAARAADDTVETQVKTSLKNRPSRKPEQLKKPDHLVEGGASSPKQSMIREAASSRTNQAALGIAGLVGAVGLGGLPAFPTNYEKADTLKSFPGASIVRESNNADEDLGYWVVLKTSGREHTVLLPSGGTTTVEFPTQRDPPFDSTGQARNAYTRYSESVQDGRRELPAVLQDVKDPVDKRTWTDTSLVTMFGDGMWLVSQKHRDKDEKRFAIAGKDSDGNVIFVQPGGTAGTNPETYPDAATALEHFRKWNDERGGVAPDPSEERPTHDELTESLSTVGGSIGTLGTAALGVGAAAVLILLVKVIA